jgi:hypothetical protein
MLGVQSPVVAEGGQGIALHSPNVSQPLVDAQLGQ